MAKFSFTGLNLGTREYNRASLLSVTFCSLHTELKEAFFFLQVCLPELKAIALTL